MSWKGFTFLAAITWTQLESFDAGPTSKPLYDLRTKENSPEMTLFYCLAGSGIFLIILSLILPFVFFFFKLELLNIGIQTHFYPTEQLKEFEKLLTYGPLDSLIPEGKGIVVEGTSRDNVKRAEAQMRYFADKKRRMSFPPCYEPPTPQITDACEEDVELVLIPEDEASPSLFFYGNLAVAVKRTMRRHDPGHAINRAIYELAEIRNLDPKVKQHKELIFGHLNIPDLAKSEQISFSLIPTTTEEMTTENYLSDLSEMDFSDDIFQNPRTISADTIWTYEGTHRTSPPTSSSKPVKPPSPKRKSPTVKSPRKKSSTISTSTTPPSSKKLSSTRLQVKKTGSSPAGSR